MIVASDPRWASVAANVKTLRRARHWSVRQLSEELSAMGVRIQRSVLANLESGRRPTVSVDELAALGQLFEVEPWSLTSHPVCVQCKGWPPDGYICGTCGKRAGFVSGADFVLGPE